MARPQVDGFGNSASGDALAERGLGGDVEVAAEEFLQVDEKTARSIRLRSCSRSRRLSTSLPALATPPATDSKTRRCDEPRARAAAMNSSRRPDSSVRLGGIRAEYFERGSESASDP